MSRTKKSEPRKLSVNSLDCDRSPGDCFRSPCENRSSLPYFTFAFTPNANVRQFWGPPEMQQDYSNLKDVEIFASRVQSFHSEFRRVKAKVWQACCEDDHLVKNGLYLSVDISSFLRKSTVCEVTAWFLSRVRISNLAHMQCYILLIKKQNKKPIHAHTCRIFTCRELTTSCFLFIFTQNDLWNSQKITC